MIMEFLIVLLMFAVPVFAALIGKRESAKVKAYKIEQMEEEDSAEPAAPKRERRSLRGQSELRDRSQRVDSAPEGDSATRSINPSKEKGSKPAQEAKNPAFEKLASLSEKEKLLIYPEIMKPKFDE